MNTLYIIQKINLLLPLNSETLTSYLSPILGQFNIKNSDFLKKFIIDFNNFTNFIFEEKFSFFLNDQSKLLAELDLIIPLTLVILKNNKYEIWFKTPQVGFLIKYYIQSMRYYSKPTKYMRYFCLYKLAYLKSIIISVGLNKNKIKINYFQIRHYFKKMKKFYAKNF